VKARDHIRALLITAHLVFVFALSTPAPGLFMREKAFQRPDVQEWFGRFAAVSTAVGRPTDREAVTASAWALGERWQTARRRTLQYVHPYAEYCGVRQGWYMFAGVLSKSARLEVDIEFEDEWLPLFHPFVADAQWRRQQLRSARVRTALQPLVFHRREGRAELLAERLAIHAAAEFPEATRLRVQMVPVRIPPAAQLRKLGELPRGEPYFVNVVDLDDYR
jgi:hypothetical protein